MGAIRYKKMFGEYMVYVYEKPILLICDNTVFVKILDCIGEKMKDAEKGFPYIKDIEYVHPLFEHSWGQRVVRFYDLDKHIIEVGENMNMVIKRFIDSGLSIEETAARMDVPVSYIELESGLC